MDSLQRLISLFNCAMEHVPPQTQKILGRLAQIEAQALEKALNPPPTPTSEKPPEA
jgi:hypothetical protein